MKKFLAALLACLATSASATTATRDYSDLWFNAAESGWGLNIAQQGETLFATLFVYNADTTPTWFVASNLAHQGNNVFTGTLLRVTGPFYIGTFNPNAVQNTEVGTMTFTGAAATPGSAALTYTINGLTVNKNITRQTFRMETVAGQYVGGSIGAYAGCAAGNGPYDQPATFTILQTASAVQISEFGPDYTCQYNGTYTQSGRLGAITGTGTCAGQSGTQTFNASEITVTPEGMTAKLVAGRGTCQFTGKFGGVRRQ